MNKKIKALLSSIAAIALSAGLTVGGTFALLTDEDKVSVSVTMANVEMDAYVDEASLLLKTTLNSNYESKTHFQNGGTAKVETGNLILERMAPGDYVIFDIILEDQSNITVDYNIEMSISDTDTTDTVDLTDALVAKATIGTQTYDVKSGVGTGWVQAAPEKITVRLEFENKTDGSNNLYKTKGAEVTLTVKVQQSTTSN